MTYLRKILIGIGIVLLAAAVLLWFLPARWALPLIEPQLHGLQLRQPSGTVWRGRAARVQDPAGRVLGRLQWQLSRRALLGQVRLRLDFDGPQLAFSGHVRRPTPGRIELRQVKLRADLSPLASRWHSPLGQPGGEVQLAVDHASLQGGWPLQLQAVLRWQHAVMRTAAGEVALGAWQLQAQSQGGVIEAQFRDDGRGPLQGHGQLQLSPLGWRLDAVLQPRQANPALGHWLRQLGPADADGAVHVRRNGGLAGSLPAPPPTETPDRGNGKQP